MKSKDRSAIGARADRRLGAAHSASRVRDILRRAADKPAMAARIELLESRTMLSSGAPQQGGVAEISEAGDITNLIDAPAGSPLSPGNTSLQQTESPLATQVNNWIGGQDAAWETAANWSTGLVPGPSDDVVIDTAAGNSITLTSAATINSLTLGGAAGAAQTLTISGSGSLNLAAASSIQAACHLINSKSISGTGTLTINGQLQLKSGTVSLPLANQGLISSFGTNDIISGALTTAGGSRIHVEGNSNVGRAHLTVAAGFTNSGTIELTDSTSNYGAT